MALCRMPILHEPLRSSVSLQVIYASCENTKIKSQEQVLGFLIFLERAMGLEPTTAAMARRYSSQLSYARGLLVREVFYIFFWKIKFFQQEQKHLDSCIRRNDRNEKIFCIIVSFLYNPCDVQLVPVVKWNNKALLRLSHKFDSCRGHQHILISIRYSVWILVDFSFCTFSRSHYNSPCNIPLATSERVFYQKIGLEFREAIYLRGFGVPSNS